MASILYRSVARIKLFPYGLKRDENNRTLRRLQGDQLHFISDRWHEGCSTSFRRYFSMNRALTSSTLATDIVRDCSDFNVKPFDNPNIMCHAQYHQLMECYIDRSDIRSVQNLVGDMNQNGPSPTMITLTKMLAAHSKDPIRLQYKLDQMRLSGMALTGGMIGALLNTFAESGSILRVEKSLYEAIEQGYIADMDLLNEVIRAYATLKNPKAAELVIKGMPELGLQPNEETMHQLMTAYANAGDIIGTDQALSRFENMGFTPTATTMSLVLSSIVNDTENTFDPKLFRSCYSEYFNTSGENNKLIPNTLTYTQLLLAAEKDGSIDSTLVVYNELLASGLKPTMLQKQIVKVVVGAGAFKEYFGTKELKDLKNVNSLLFSNGDVIGNDDDRIVSQESKVGVSAANASSSDVREQEEGITESLKSYAFKGDVMSIKRILAEERISGIQSDLYTINALIYAYCQNGDIMTARKVITKMQEPESRLKPDESTMKIVMQEMSLRGDIKGVEEMFQEVISIGLKADIHFLNDVIRAYSVSADPVGAETVLSALPDLGLEPDETSIKLAMMAYANAGDVYGMEAIFEKYESMGFKSTTATMNIVLKAIVNAPNLDWTYLKTMKETLFNPKNFQPDVNTYVQLLLACEKYDKAGDAILWFNEFINLESKIEITQLIKNIYRQVVEGDDYDKDSPTCPKWETDIKFDIRDDLENSMDYTKLWSKSVKILVDNGEFDDIQKVHPSKVCGVDDDIVVKKSYYSSPSFYEKTISDRISLKQPVSTGIFNSLLQCYVKLEDYESANILFYERSKEYGVHLDHHSISNLLAALVKLGDPMGAEKLLEYALTLEIPIGFQHLQEVLRAYALKSNVIGAEKAYSAMRNLNMRPNKETFHLLMIAYASGGDTKGCAKIFQKYLSFDLELTTVVMNINLASVIYNDEEFNWDVFSLLYKRYYESGEVKSDRFTYTQLLIACGKAGKTDLAIKYFEEALDSNEIKISVALRNTFQEAIGTEKYNEWKSKLNSKDQYLLFNAIDTTPKKPIEKDIEGNVPMRKIPPKYIPTGYRDLPPKKFEGLTGFKNTANVLKGAGAVQYKSKSSSSVSSTHRKVFDLWNKSFVYVPPE